MGWVCTADRNKPGDSAASAPLVNAGLVSGQCRRVVTRAGAAGRSQEEELRAMWAVMQREGLMDSNRSILSVP